ncbi:MAG: site-specific integrase [Bacteroidales bacterium]|nr:site-specific integrase [Bacteroidales bacterium]
MESEYLKRKRQEYKDFVADQAKSSLSNLTLEEQIEVIREKIDAGEEIPLKPKSPLRIVKKSRKEKEDRKQLESGLSSVKTEQLEDNAEKEAKALKTKIVRNYSKGPFATLNKRKPTKNGEYSVYIGLGYNKDIYFPTGITAKLSQWDKKKRRCKGKDAKEKNQVIERHLEEVFTMVADMKKAGLFDRANNSQLRAMHTIYCDCSVEMAALALERLCQQRIIIQNGVGNYSGDAVTLTAVNSGQDGIVAPKQNENMVSMFLNVAKAKNQRSGELVMDTLKKLLQLYKPEELQFNAINKLWLEDFQKRCKKLNLSDTTIGLHLRYIRMVYNYAVEEGKAHGNPFKHFKIPRGGGRKRAISADEIRRLMNLELPEHLCKYRDILMLTFCLIGINFVDLCRLKEIKNGRVEYRRAKTGKPYSIKVEPEAMKLIEKLKGEKFLLYFLDNHKDYKTYYRQLGRGLREIKKLIGLEELSTYTMRHSWATIASWLEIPKETISAGLGHDIGNRITAVYIDYDRSKPDEANRIVLDWIYKKKLPKGLAKRLGHKES